MDPDTLLAQDDLQLLVQVLNTFALEVNAAIHLDFHSKPIVRTSTHLFDLSISLLYFLENTASEEQ